MLWLKANWKYVALGILVLLLGKSCFDLGMEKARADQGFELLQAAQDTIKARDLTLAETDSMLGVAHGRVDTIYVASAVHVAKADRCSKFGRAGHRTSLPRDSLGLRCSHHGMCRVAEGCDLERLSDSDRPDGHPYDPRHPQECANEPQGLAGSAGDSRETLCLQVPLCVRVPLSHRELCGGWLPRWNGRRRHGPAPEALAT